MGEVFLNVKNIHKYFGKIHILKGISLEVNKGTTVVLIGRSGSGKSTLLRCINLLEPIQDGEILFKGKNIKEYNVRKLREQIGMVFQSYNLFPHLTAIQNVTLALKVVRKIPAKEAYKIGVDMLEKVGLKNKIESFPSTLSGGQQQRVAIARSLAMKPLIMMFDEVTSALDPELIGEVLKVMEELAKEEMTMLVVTHEMGFATHVADKVVFLNDGLIIEEGKPNQIFNNPKDENLKRFIEAIL